MQKIAMRIWKKSNRDGQGCRLSLSNRCALVDTINLRDTPTASTVIC